MDASKMIKVLPDEMGVSFNPSMFFVLFRSGDNSTAYVLNPGGAKVFSENLASRIKEYESTIGPIDTTGHNIEIVSPMQP